MPCFAIPKRMPQYSNPRVVVGLDFGTTFSGFAFCKTLTGCYYKNVGGEWQFKSWGYPARAEFAWDFQAVRKQRGSADPLQPSTPGARMRGVGHGSRYASHLLERMAFKSTSNHSHFRLVLEVEAKCHGQLLPGADVLHWRQDTHAKDGRACGRHREDPVV
jgi:hypothetical protein